MTFLIVRFVILLLISWCTMTIVHESGHLVGGWLTGGTLEDYSLAPWSLPYSRFEPDPHPLVTLWAGPLVGVLVPLLLAIIVRRPAIWFISHFCTLANGVYLALAWLTGDHHLDTPRLMEKGASPFWIALFCTVTISFGYVGFRKACVLLLTKTVQNHR